MLLLQNILVNITPENVLQSLFLLKLIRKMIWMMKWKTRILSLLLLKTMKTTMNTKIKKTISWIHLIITNITLLYTNLIQNKCLFEEKENTKRGINGKNAKNYLKTQSDCKLNGEVLIKINLLDNPLMSLKNWSNVMIFYSIWN